MQTSTRSFCKTQHERENTPSLVPQSQDAPATRRSCRPPPQAPAVAAAAAAPLTTQPPPPQSGRLAAPPAAAPAVAPPAPSPPSPPSYATVDGWRRVAVWRRRRRGGAIGPPGWRPESKGRGWGRRRDCGDGQVRPKGNSPHIGPSTWSNRCLTAASVPQPVPSPLGQCTVHGPRLRCSNAATQRSLPTYHMSSTQHWPSPHPNTAQMARIGQGGRTVMSALPSPHGAVHCHRHGRGRQAHDRQRATCKSPTPHSH